MKPAFAGVYVLFGDGRKNFEALTEIAAVLTYVINVYIMTSL
jgi:hypothetical protein